MIPLRLLTIPVCASLVLMAQTTAETEAIRQSLDTIQQKATTLKAMMDSSVKPTNWRDLVIADSNAIVTAATTAKTTAETVAATSSSTTTGRSITVPPGGSIQNALNEAIPGDTIILQAGAVYPGAITLPTKSGTAYITITTSAAASLPQGARVGPAQASLMARIVGQNGGPVILTATAAHHYRLIGLEILAQPGVYGSDVVQLGRGSETSDSQLVSDIELDRLWIHAEAPAWAKRGVAMNGKRLVLKNSRVSGFRSTWQETQAVCAWNTPGPLQISNNYLEGAGMALMIGGADPTLIGSTPSDIQIIGNLMSRPVAWRTESLVIKNVMELKTGRRVSITGNIFENTWTAAQSGYAVNIKPGTENVRTPAITSDVLFANNIVRHVAAGLTVVGTNSYGGKVSNVTIRNNLFDDLGPAWGARLSLFTVFGGVAGITVENNTAAPTVSINTLLLSDLAPSSGLTFRGNIAPRGTYGVFGSGSAEGTRTLTAYFPGAIFTNNVIYNSVQGLAPYYPTGNYFPLTATEVGWTNVTGGNYTLASTSTYKGTGVGGLNPGVDMAALLSATAKTVAGR